MKTQNYVPTFKVKRKDLQNILGVSDKTARKEYRVICACLSIAGRGLTFQDLADYGLIKLQ